jgi:hypothetical protein
MGFVVAHNYGVSRQDVAGVNLCPEGIEVFQEKFVGAVLVGEINLGIILPVCLLAGVRHLNALIGIKAVDEADTVKTFRCEAAEAERDAPVFPDEFFNAKFRDILHVVLPQ